MISSLFSLAVECAVQSSAVQSVVQVHRSHPSNLNASAQDTYTRYYLVLWCYYITVFIYSFIRCFDATSRVGDHLLSSLSNIDLFSSIIHSLQFNSIQFNLIPLSFLSLSLSPLHHHQASPRSSLNQSNESSHTKRWNTTFAWLSQVSSF